MTTGVRFWNDSEVHLAMDATGFRLDTQALMSLLVGGLAFELPPRAEPGVRAPAGAEFTAFADRRTAMRRPDVATDTYVLRFRGSVAFKFVALFLLSQAACATSRAEHFFVLTDVERAASPPSGSYAGSLVVDPVSLPELVDRPQFVIRGEGGRVVILEQQRWAEPLWSGVARLMAAQLGRLLGTTSVSSSDGVLARPDHRVAVDIRTLDSAPGRGVTVEALWSVRARMARARPGTRGGKHRARMETTAPWWQRSPGPWPL